MTELEKAWLAGFVDGEGTISLHRLGTNDNYYEVYVAVTNTNREVLELINRFYPGTLVSTGERTNLKWKDGFRWKVTSKSTVEKVLKDILPYLVIKKRQALLLLEYIEINNQQFLERDELYKQIKGLNKRGN